MTNARQNILDAVITRLKTITVANGYNLAIGTKVYDWKLSPVKPADLPAIEVRDTDAPIEVGDLAGGLIHRLTMNIVVLASGTSAAATVRKGLQDISRAMYTDRTFGGLVKTFTPLSSTIEMQQEENLLSAGQYSCTMTYYTAPGEI